MNKLIAFVASVIFGFGLAVSGMINPAKVLGFLDFFGNWDPTLAFVMGGAILVSFPAFQLARKRERPMLADSFKLPTNTSIDRRLLAGAALFGIGWGLGGFCPGPAIAALGSLQWPIFGFLAAMLVGQWLADRIAGSTLFQSADRHETSGEAASGDDA